MERFGRIIDESIIAVPLPQAEIVIDHAERKHAVEWTGSPIPDSRDEGPVLVRKLDCEVPLEVATVLSGNDSFTANSC